ncbi:hypothetical protein I7I50_10397 [Histoplasma capsulatum G186AR]|uniref:Uncharacterized protein n=1 Tax=Ajellomyces capsulatus TaxID=5037 RepID=A0A8H7Z898_AJECA|nr:hypothetical protein I7I52_01636 [Histoplasma capsulatum]QSS69194.1 hypothetical protein I7I50_10397 [Histoplasma capsulatum G186AR]
MKSKKRPKGINDRAIHKSLYSVKSPRQYRIDEKIDMTPQNPFNSVTRSARCNALIKLKWPESAESSIFCLSRTRSFMFVSVLAISGPAGLGVTELLLDIRGVL